MPTIDKIIIYGVPNPQRLKLTEVLSNNIKVTTLQAYSRQSQSLRPKNQIDFEMWAYPDGIKIYNNSLQIINDSEPEFSFFQSTDLLNQGSPSKTPPQYIYSFVLTDYDLNRTYCTCLIWNERYFIKDDRLNVTQDIEMTKSLTQSMDKSQKKILFQPKQKYSLAIPKCKIETMINNPLILDTNTTPVFVPKAIIACSKIPCIQLQRSLLRYYHEIIIKEQTGKTRKCVRIPRLFENELNELIKNNGYSKAQRIFDNQKSQTIRRIQLKLLKKTFKDSEKDKSTGYLNVETTKLKQFFISSLFTLPGDPKNSFIVSQSGIPIASKFKADTVFQLPKFFDVFSGNQSFEKLPFQLIPLPIPQFVQLWKCVLLEKQIILFSNSQLKSLMLSQMMLFLIQPIKWQNIYIPFLPFHLAHHIEAIGGYLIGMSRIHMDYMLEKFQMKNKVVVDLQHKTILEEGGKQVIELPQSIKAYVQKSLKKIVDSYQQSRKPNRGLINYLITSKQQPGPKQKIKTIQNFVKHWMEIQKLFFHTLVMLFNNFIPFIIKKQDGIIAFRTQDYLNILDDRQHRTFMKEISKTMVFIRLCEYHVQESARCAWVQKNIGELFVYSHDILSHKFVVTDSDLNKGLADFQKLLQRKNAENTVGTKQRAYAWTVQDLLLQHEKYYQYIEYLFNKNLKQLMDTIELIGYYLGEEQKKYKILNSEDQFESFESLESIELPADFGKKLRSENSTMIEKSEKEQQYRKIYQKIQSEQVAKSKRNKKYGDKDEEELYEQFSKQCIDLKVQRFLTKYLKFMELNHPETIVKVANKGNKKQKNRSGILNWLWDLVNPPDSNRGKQQLEIKSKLQRKITMKNMKIQSTLNLNRLFDQQEQEITDDRKKFGQLQTNKKIPKQKQAQVGLKQSKKSKEELVKHLKQNDVREYLNQKKSGRLTNPNLSQSNANNDSLCQIFKF